MTRELYFNSAHSHKINPTHTHVHANNHTHIPTRTHTHTCAQSRPRNPEHTHMHSQTHSHPHMHTIMHTITNTIPRTQIQYTLQIIFGGCIIYENIQHHKRLIIVELLFDLMINDKWIHLKINEYIHLLLYRVFFSLLPLNFLITPPIFNFLSFWKLL